MKIQDFKNGVKNFEQGVSVFFACIVMLILLAIVLGITTILTSEIKMIKSIGFSVVALYAADTGMERVLYEDEFCRQQLPPCAWPCELDCSRLSDGASFSDTIGEASYTATASNSATTFQSIGFYKQTRRAIETNR